MTAGFRKAHRKAHEKYAWLLLFPSGLLLLLFLAGSLLQGYIFDPDGKTLNWLTSDPEILHFIRWGFTFYGLPGVGFAIFIMAASVTSYRGGERWAWYAFLYLPVYLLGLLAIAYWLWPITVPLLIMSLLGLLLPYRKFFPTK